MTRSGEPPRLRRSGARRFYDGAGLLALATVAGFTGARVERRDLEAYARASGVPEERLALFRGGARFLFARQDEGEWRQS